MIADFLKLQGQNTQKLSDISADYYSDGLKNTATTRDAPAASYNPIMAALKAHGDAMVVPSHVKTASFYGVNSQW